MLRQRAKRGSACRKKAGPSSLADRAALVARGTRAARDFVDDEIPGVAAAPVLGPRRAQPLMDIADFDTVVWKTTCSPFSLTVTVM